MLVFYAKKGSEKMIDRLETMLSKYNDTYQNKKC